MIRAAARGRPLRVAGNAEWGGGGDAPHSRLLFPAVLLQWATKEACGRAKERETMSQGVSCPACGSEKLDVRRYDAMMVVRADLALFTLRCPRCGAVVSSMQRIPAELLDEVRFAAIEVGAGMGRE